MNGRERLALVAGAIMGCPTEVEGYKRLNDQRAAALVVAGHKPAHEIHLFGPDSETREAANPVSEQDIAAVEVWLHDLGVVWRVIKDDVLERGTGDRPWSRRRIYGIARTTSDLDALEQLWAPGLYPSDVYEHGRLSGFPATAIKACLDSPRSAIPIEQLPRQLTDEPVMATVQFMFSRAHWREELEEVRPWMLEIRETLPKLYEELEHLNAAVYRRQSLPE